MSSPRMPSRSAPRRRATPAKAATPPAPGGLDLMGMLHSQPDLNHLLQAAGQACAALVGARIARVWVQKKAGGRLSSVDSSGAGEGGLRELRIEAGEGLAGWVTGRGQSLRLGPGDPRPDLAGPVPAFNTALVVPLLRRGEAFGAVECLDASGGGSFGEAQLERLRMAATQIAVAADNALLHRATMRRELEKEVLLEVSMTLSGPLELDEVLDAILAMLRKVVRYDAAAIYLVDRKTGALAQVREVGYPAGSEDAFRLQVGQGIIGWVAKTGTALNVPDTTEDFRYVAARPMTRSELAAPLLLEGEAIGVFNLESDRPDVYHDEDLELLAAFAAQAAVAIERARLVRERLERRHFERELSIAREIQASYLPRAAPTLAHFEVAGMNRQHADVGGDYFDFIRVGEHRLGIAIADVSGKGIPAALIMAGFRAGLLAEIRNDFAIRAVMAKANALLLESRDRGKFVTCFYGLLDDNRRALTFCNAGHNPPLLRRVDGRIEYLTEGGVALGVLPNAHYDDRPVMLAPGDLLVLYTDGVTEALNDRREEFDQGRLERTVEDLHQGSAQEILDGIVRAVLEWSGEERLSDDLTVVVLKTR